MGINLAFVFAAVLLHDKHNLIIAEARYNFISSKFLMLSDDLLEQLLGQLVQIVLINVYLLVLEFQKGFLTFLYDLSNVLGMRHFVELEKIILLKVVLDILQYFLFQGVDLKILGYFIIFSNILITLELKLISVQKIYYFLKLLSLG